MAFLKIENVKISGISACVPKQIEDNASCSFFDDDGLKNFVATTGIERRRKSDNNVCTSDLCVSAAETLISNLCWIKEDISIVVFVTQTPDYILPATSSIIQQRLGLGKDCYTLDVSLGCSGWVYGMSVISTLMMNITPHKAKALLLVGDTPSKMVSPNDKSTYPLFGDAGTVTALEYKPDAEPIFFSMNSDGSGYNAIMINDGGYRNLVSLSSLDEVERGEGIVSNNLQVMLDGMNVFSFGIREAPKSVNGLIERFNLDKDKIDYFTFHQANLFMNEQIRKKLKLPPEKVPYSLKEFGNTSSASIPLTMITELQKDMSNNKLQHIACGFGVGLSWGSMYFTTDHIVCPPLIEM
ncbi:MAG: ketoacyl-ACP synthase III [Treponema sp.]|jgi:3-oxoacyl-[acyl-carrier-protein] synthase-3|nr:ketoacyl-ACP synthase III [Treponema sp.]